MKTTLATAALFLVQALLGQKSFADCVGSGAANSVSVQVKKFHPAYFRDQKIEGCIAEIVDIKTGKSLLGFSRFEFICQGSEKDVFKININQLCCDGGDFPEPCGVTVKNQGAALANFKGVVFEPAALDERSFPQIRKGLSSKEFFAQIKAMRDLKKILNRKPFRNELEALFESKDYRVKGEASYLLLTSSGLVSTAIEKWRYTVFALNSISRQQADEALSALNPRTVPKEQQVMTLDVVLDDLHHSNRSDLALEVLRKVNQEVRVSLISKRLDPASPTVIPQNALIISTQLGAKAQKLEPKLIEYIRYPYIDLQHRNKVAKALCSIQQSKIEKLNFENGKILISCNPVSVQKVECQPVPCQE